MSTNKHAALMLQYAQDWAETDEPWERWEVSAFGNKFVPLHVHPGWREEHEYRRKPHMMTYTVTIPKPIQEAPDSRIPRSASVDQKARGKLDTEGGSMSDKPEALLLAGQLESGEPVTGSAAAELRRLHAVNQELLEALQWHESIKQHGYMFATPDRLKHFAELVAAAEREACAKVMDNMAKQDKHSNYYKVAAKSIRARGEA